MVINDGDVAALAGSMSLEENGVLGIALGSSEAAGFVDKKGHILGWLNELAFAPIDYSPRHLSMSGQAIRVRIHLFFATMCLSTSTQSRNSKYPKNVPNAEKLVYRPGETESRA